jgi:single-stranded-DNA-specific exonuclease
VNLYLALERAAPHLVRYGGHAAAAGLTVAMDQVELLRDALLGRGQRADRRAGERTSAPSADAEVELGEVDETLADELASLAPFGKGNEQPILSGGACGCATAARWATDPTSARPRGPGARCAAPSLSAWASAIPAGRGGRLRLLAGISTWRGARSVELSIRELAPATP